MDQCRTIEEMLSAYLDGELTQQDRQRVEVHADSCGACGKTLAELKRISAGIGGLHTPEPTPEQWSRMMPTVVTKTSRGLGWLLALIGGAILVGYAIYQFATDDTVDALIKIAVAGVVGGLALLLLSVILDRLRAGKTDRYKDVEL